MKPFLITAAVLLAIPAAGAAQTHNHSGGNHAHHHAARPAATTKTARIVAGPGAVVKVNGLICDFCVQALNKTFKRQAAVRDVAVDLDAKEIRLAFKPGATLDDATINRLVKNAGYNVVSISRRPA
jgi:copper chaperone CopZ